MKQKLLLIMLTVLSLQLATSCSEKGLGPDDGNEALISFSIGVESNVKTRAISDGKSVNQLTYAIFNEKDEMLGFFKDNTAEPVTFVANTVDAKEFEEGKAKEITIALAKGQTYKIAFWVQNKDCSAYDLKNFPDVKVNYTKDDGSYMLNNEESRDAFFAMKEINVTGHAKIDVELIRPFAQINVGVTDADWEAAITSQREIKTSKVIINKAASKINLLSGNVSDPVEVVYDFAPIPKSINNGTDDNPEYETLEVDLNNDGINESYYYLSMCYILVNDGNAGGAERATLDKLEFTFHSNESQKDIEFKEGLNSVPVQRNWRTNIVGQILSGNQNINIIVEPGYYGNENYTKFEQVEGAPEGVVYDNQTNTYGISDVAGFDWMHTMLNALETKAAATTDNLSIVLLGNIDMTGKDWSLFNSTTNANSPAAKLTSFAFDGNGYTISNWKTSSSLNALFVPTGHCNTEFIFKNIIISNCSVDYVTNAENSGAALFLGWREANNKDVTFDNCKIINSSVKGSKYAGGFISYTGNENKTTVININNCSLTDKSEIIGFGSAGGFIGQSCNTMNINNAIVTGSTIKGENENKSGIIIGSSNNGTSNIKTSDIAGNTVYKPILT